MGCGWRGSAFHRWRLVQGRGGVTLPVFNPATGETIGSLAQAEAADLDRALAAADRGFKIWRKVSAYDRGKVLRKAGDLLRSRAEAIAPVMTREQGKPCAEPEARWRAAPTFSTGSPRRRGEPMGASSRRAATRCSKSSRKSRSGRTAMQLQDKGRCRRSVPEVGSSASAHSQRRRHLSIGWGFLVASNGVSRTDCRCGPPGCRRDARCQSGT
jgi:hypothetical protein